MRPVSRSPAPEPPRVTPAIAKTPAPTPGRTLSRHKRTVPREQPRAAPRGDGSIAQLCVDEINRYRATLGLRPLERDADREACADTQIADDSRSGHWHGKYGACGESVQNECMASPGEQAGFLQNCLKDMWNEGPGGGHYENMKNASATKVWCGFYTTPSGDRWSVQDFR
jgi:hypothetical protein